MIVEQKKIRFRISDYGPVFERCKSELSIGFTGTIPDSTGNKVFVEICGEERKPTKLCSGIDNLSKTAIECTTVEKLGWWNESTQKGHHWVRQKSEMS